MINFYPSLTISSVKIFICFKSHTIRLVNTTVVILICVHTVLIHNFSSHEINLVKKCLYAIEIEFYRKGMIFSKCLKFRESSVRLKSFDKTV